MSEAITVVEPTVVTSEEIDTRLAVHKSEQSLPPAPVMKFFTTNAQDLAATQGKLSAWCRMKISELENDLLEIEREHEIAVKNKWRASPWKKRAGIVGKRIEYYKKIAAAIEDGYVIVPAMPMDVFAVRVTNRTPRASICDYRTHNQAEQAAAAAAPLGEGRYVSDENEVCRWDSTYKDANGKEQVKHLLQATAYGDVDFPIDVAKPIVMEATAKAMALKAFDEVGVVRDRQGTNRRGDPFVVGRIIDPRPNRAGMSFFIGWYIDVSEL